MTSTETNKQLMIRWWEELNQGNAPAVIDDIYADSYILHDPSLPEPVRGRQGVREFISNVVAGFPDAHYTIEGLVAEGDKVVQHISVRGTHQGEFQGIPATGKPVAIWAMIISRVADGQVVEEWQLVDGLTMLQQLGVIPEQDAAAG